MRRRTTCGSKAATPAKKSSNRTLNSRLIRNQLLDNDLQNGRQGRPSSFLGLGDTFGDTFLATKGTCMKQEVTKPGVIVLVGLPTLYGRPLRLLTR